MGNHYDLTIVLVIGLSAGTIVSTLTWPLIDHGMTPQVKDRNQWSVLAGVVLMGIGLIGLAAAPRWNQLNTIAAQTWQHAGFAYLFAIFWMLPIFFGRAANAKSWETLGREWRRCLKYLCLAGAIAALLIVFVQATTVASMLALMLALAAAASVWRTT